MSYEAAVQQWRDGLRRLDAALVEQPVQARLLDRVTAAIYEELRRRLGSTFTTEELAELYDGGTAWAQQLAMRTAPESPEAWEPRTVVDAAFGRYVREATDYAGGRRLTPGAPAE